MMKEYPPQSVWDRRSQVLVAPNIYAGNVVRIFHESPLGRWIYRFFLSRPIISQILALPDFTCWSRKKIPAFIKKYNLDSSSFVKPVIQFQSFNDFFIRELRPEHIPFNPLPDSICSPCEAQLEICRCVDSSDNFKVKGITFSLGRLIGKTEITRQFCGGDICTFYLAPQYYHRFHFPVGGEWRQHWVMGHRLFAVNEFSFRNGFRPFDINVRHINTLWHHGLEEFLYIEIGATMVGRIHQCQPLTTKNGSSVPRMVKKGEQKGFFSLGGSAVLIIFMKNKINFSQDILEKNQEGLPVWVRPGEVIGQIIEGTENQ